MIASPLISLNDGSSIPQFGLGVFEIPEADTYDLVSYALQVGYRHIDTAALYKNEAAVGKAIADSGIPREELYITTKLWNNHQGITQARPAFEASLERLGVDYVDLYLIHWPAPMRDQYVQTWEVFQEIAEDKLAHSIGVSNFLPEHLMRIIALGGRFPAVNQVEMHPRFQQRNVIAANDHWNISTEAWSPLGRGSDLNATAIEDIARLREITPAQVILAWHITQGRIVFPRSSQKKRIQENFNALDTILSPRECAAIDSLESGNRIGPDPETFMGKDI